MATPKQITPCLWFDTQAEDAANRTVDTALQADVIGKGARTHVG